MRGIYKLRQRLEPFKDEEDQDNLDDRAQEALDYYKSPFQQLELTQLPETLPAITDYALGDIGVVKVQYGNLNINNVYRIKSIDVSISDSGGETVKVGVDSVN